MSKLVVIDFETTGLTPSKDEILQVSILDESGSVLMNEYCKPARHTAWPQAQKINGISPEMVSSKPPFAAFAAEVRTILEASGGVIAYNDSFEKAFLEANGIPAAALKWREDPMLTFSQAFPAQKKNLSTVAAFFDYSFAAHDALEDVRATLYVYQQMCGHSFVDALLRDAQAAPNGAAYDTLPQAQMLRLLKALGLCPFTAAAPKVLYYKGIHADKPVLCQVVGFEQVPPKNNWLVLVIESEGKLLRIGSSYLKEMQSPSFSEEDEQTGKATCTPQAVSRSAARASFSTAKANRFSQFKANSEALKNLRANENADPGNPFFQKSVVFTGNLPLSREDAALRVSDLGATVKSAVSAKTDFLIVGTQDASLVGADGLSGKERKAEEINASGKGTIQILHESDFMNLLQPTQKID